MSTFKPGAWVVDEDFPEPRPLRAGVVVPREGRGNAVRVAYVGGMVSYNSKRNQLRKATPDEIKEVGGEVEPLGKPRLLYILEPQGFRLCTKAEAVARAQWTTPDEEPPRYLRPAVAGEDRNTA